MVELSNELLSEDVSCSQTALDCSLIIEDPLTLEQTYYIHRGGVSPLQVLRDLFSPSGSRTAWGTHQLCSSLDGKKSKRGWTNCVHVQCEAAGCIIRTGNDTPRSSQKTFKNLALGQELRLKNGGLILSAATTPARIQTWLAHLITSLEGQTKVARRSNLKPVLRQTVASHLGETYATHSLSIPKI